MPDLARIWTRDEVLALPDDGNRYELVDGELLVTPAPRLAHQQAVQALFRQVDPYVRTHRLGATFLSPADLDLRSGQVVQPDLFVSQLVDGRSPKEWTDVGIPLLVAEVVSPASARNDRLRKRRRFQRSGVPTYWIVDLEARMVEVWTPGDERAAAEDERLPWQPEGSVPALVIDLPAYFEEVLGG